MGRIETNVVVLPVQIKLKYPHLYLPNPLPTGDFSFESW